MPKNGYFGLLPTQQKCLGFAEMSTPKTRKIGFSKFLRGRKKFLKFFFLVKISTKKFFFRKKNPITQNMRIADFRENVDFWGIVQKRWSLGAQEAKIPIFQHVKSVSRQDFPRFDIF